MPTASTSTTTTPEKGRAINRPPNSVPAKPTKGRSAPRKRLRTELEDVTDDEEQDRHGIMEETEPRGKRRRTRYHPYDSRRAASEGAATRSESKGPGAQESVLKASVLKTLGGTFRALPPPEPSTKLTRSLLPRFNPQPDDTTSERWPSHFSSISAPDFSTIAYSVGVRFRRNGPTGSRHLQLGTTRVLQTRAAYLGRASSPRSNVGSQRWRRDRDDGYGRNAYFGY